MKIQMNYDRIINLFNKIMIILLGYILLLSVFKPYETYITYKEAHNLKSIVLILGIIILSLLIIKNINYIFKASNKRLIIINLLMIGIILIGQIIYIINFKYVNYSDLSEVHSCAIEIVKNGFIDKNDYLARCSNNIPITLFWAFIFKVYTTLGITNLKLSAIFTNMFIIDAAILMMCLIIRRNFGNKKMTSLLGLICINPIIYAYLPTYYTNTVSLFFYIGLIYLYDLYINKTKNKLIFILFSFLSVLGIKIRVTVGIIIIAILIHCYMKEKFYSFLKFIVSMFLVSIIILTTLNSIENKFIKFDYSDTALPVTHYLMIGSSGVGGYNYSDVVFSSSFETHSDKVKGTTKEFINRIIKAKVKGNIERINTKIDRVWASGTYGFRQSANNVEEFSKLYPYILGERSKIFNYYCQIYQGTILLFAVAYLIGCYKKKEMEFQDIYKLIIFGGFIFYIFWEANSRYGLMFVPFIMFLALDGVDTVNKMNDKLANTSFQLVDNITSNKIYIDQKIIRKFLLNSKRIIFICIMFLLMWNYSTYTKENIDIYNWSVNQFNSSQRTDKINYDDIIQQTFTTDKEFNTLELKTYLDKNKFKNNLSVKIIDTNNNEVMYETLVLNKDLENNKNIKLVFNPIIPIESTKYNIEIKQDGEYENQEIILGKSYKPYYNVNSGGELKINDIDEKGNLMFKVYNMYQGTYMSVNQYLIMSISILCISLIALNMKK